MKKIPFVKLSHLYSVVPEVGSEFVGDGSTQLHCNLVAQAAVNTDDRWGRCLPPLARCGTVKRLPALLGLFNFYSEVAGVP